MQQQQCHHQMQQQTQQQSPRDFPLRLAQGGATVRLPAPAQMQRNGPRTPLPRRRHPRCSQAQRRQRRRQLQEAQPSHE
jgi:hypothetical protein